jgi:hypothetical protein
MITFFPLDPLALFKPNEHLGIVQINGVNWKWYFMNLHLMQNQSSFIDS